MAPSSPSSEMETPGVDGLAWLGDKPGWIRAPGQDWGDPTFRRLMNLGSGAGVISDFPPCRGDIPFAGAGALNHSLSCTSDSGLLRMCQKSLAPWKRGIPAWRIWQCSSTYNTLGKGDFFGAYSSLSSLAVAFCLQNKQARNMPHCSRTVGFIFL